MGDAFSRKAAVASRGSTTMTSINAGNDTTALATISAYQWVYGPLAGQTISGDVTARVRGRSGTFTNLHSARIAIWIATPAGSNRATLYSSSSAFNSTLWSTSFANYSATVTLSSGVATAGDYLILEVGAARENFLDSDEFYVEIGDTSSTNHMYFDFDDTISTEVAPTTLTYDFADTATGTLVLNEAAPTHNPTTDGVSSLTYTVNAGALPNGLSLNSSTGKITGTPTVKGSFSATIRVSNSSGNADATLSWEVVKLAQGLGSWDIRLR